jgi:signal transduction histidine kinase
MKFKVLSTLLLFFISFHAEGDEDNRIMSLVNQSQGVKKLELLDSLTSESKTTVSNIMLIEMMLKEATIQKNDHYKASAYFQLGKYYYARNPDSLRYFIRIGEPLFLREKRYDDLFRMKGWNLYVMAREEKGDEILKEANKVIRQSRQLKYPEGEEIAEQSIAFSYFIQSLYQEGERMYLDVLTKMEARKAPMSKRFNILRQLLNETMINHKPYLTKVWSYIQYCERNNIQDLGDDITLDYMKYVYYRTRAIDDCQSGQFNQAHESLLTLQKLKGVSKDDATIKNIWLLYYNNNKQYDKALEICNELLMLPYAQTRIKDLLSLEKIKADILRNTGNFKESSLLYNDYITKNDSVTSAEFYDNLAKLRNQHDMDKLALQNKQMELKAAQDHTHIQRMESGFVLMIVICLAAALFAYSRYRYGKQLKKAKEKAEESDRLKSAFLANMNHEIRTPLNAISGFSQVLVEEDDRATREQYANIIQSNNELLQRLIYDVLDLSKIESNSMELKYKDVSLQSLMKSIFEATKLRMPEHVELKLSESEDFVLNTDPNRLTQIITNLLNNAIKHTEKGEIRFGYTLEEDQVRFSVEDTGEGIPEDKLESIFGRFVQLKEMDKGVGLGLAICKGLVTQMGGAIHVTSTLGKGSTFYFVLPITLSSDNDAIKEIKGV